MKKIPRVSTNSNLKYEKFKDSPGNPISNSIQIKENIPNNKKRIVKERNSLENSTQKSCKNICKLTQNIPLEHKFPLLFDLCRICYWKDHQDLFPLQSENKLFRPAYLCHHLLRWPGNISKYTNFYREKNFTKSVILYISLDLFVGFRFKEDEYSSFYGLFIPEIHPNYLQREKKRCGFEPPSMLNEIYSGRVKLKIKRYWKKAMSASRISVPAMNMIQDFVFNQNERVSRWKLKNLDWI